jgi:Fe-S-cluster-containing hydrogenase component 2
MIAVNQRACPQNHPCPAVSSCPVGAIVQDGFSAAHIDHELCTECGACTQACRVFSHVADEVGVF